MYFVVCTNDIVLSSSVQHSRKSWVWSQEYVILEVKGQRQMDTGGLVANQASQTGELQVWQKTLSQNVSQKEMEEDTRSRALASTRSCPPVCEHTHTHTHTHTLRTSTRLKIHMKAK